MDRGINPLRHSARELRQILVEHVDLHIMAVYEEHLYLQEVLSRRFGQLFQVATLLKANRADDRDLQLFLESDLGVFLLEEKRVAQAKKWLARLKGREDGSSKEIGTAG